MYVTQDAGNIFVDINSTTRKQLSAEYSEKLRTKTVNEDNTYTYNDTTIGNASNPIYFKDGLPVAGNLYAGGTLLTLNGTTQASVNPTVYAPVVSGNAGQIAISAGANKAPIFDTSLTYSNGVLNATKFAGDGSGLTNLDATKLTNGVSFASGTLTATKFKGELEGNASSASKLKDAATITFTGDVSGSFSFDGSQTVTTPIVVNEDSHNHSFATINGLQDALDLKADKTDLTPNYIIYLQIDAEGNCSIDTTFENIYNALTSGSSVFVAFPWEEEVYLLPLSASDNEGLVFELFDVPTGKIYFVLIRMNSSVVAQIGDFNHEYVGADKEGSADTAYSNAVKYTNEYITGAATSVVKNNLTANKVVVSDASGKITVSDITSTELNALDNIAGNIQAALNDKAPLSHVSDNVKHITSEERTKWNAKQNAITGAATTIVENNLTKDLVLISNNDGKVAVSNITTTELEYLDGVTENVQTQLDKKATNDNLNIHTSNDNIHVTADLKKTWSGKQDKITGAASTVTANNLTASKVLTTNTDGKIAVSDISLTELGHLSNVNSNIQTQLDNKATNTALNTHTNDNTIHVTPEDKNKWNGKQDEITGAATTIVKNNLTASMVLVSNSDGKVAASSKITTTELEALDGIDGNIKSKLDGKVDKEDNKGLSTNDFTNEYKQIVIDTESNISLAEGRANAYTNKVIKELIDGAPQTLDTLKEIADALAENEDVVEALDQAISEKTDVEVFNTHATDKKIHITDEERTAWNDKQNKITGAASSVTENNLGLNKALISDGNGKIAASSVTSTEISYLSGVGEKIQDQLNAKATNDDLTDHTSNNDIHVTTGDKDRWNAKQNNITGAASTVTGNNLTENKVIISNASGKLAASDITTTKLGYLSDVTGNIQAELNKKALSTDLTNHIDDTVKHITNTERNTWNGKQNAITGAASTITSNNLTAGRILISNTNGKVDVSSITSAQLSEMYESYVSAEDSGTVDGEDPTIDPAVQAAIDKHTNNKSNPHGITAAQIGAKTVQTAITDPSANGNSITFIDTISQNTNGVINATKKTVRTMSAATSSTAGSTGLVPAPAAGKQTSFLRGDGTWAVPEGATYVFATGDSNGTFKVTPSNGSAQNVSIKGLGSAAYTESSAYATAAQGTLATNALPKSGGTVTGDINFTRSTTIANNTPIKLNFKVTQTDNNVSNSGYIAVYDDLDTAGNGVNMVVNATSGLYLTAGEGGGSYLANNASTAEQVHICADSTIHFHTNCNTVANATSSCYITTGGVIYGAAWNDYAEYRDQEEAIEPGYCVVSADDGRVRKTSEKFQACDGIVSDTFGFAIGETDTCKTPLAVAGRVLAYCEGDRNDYHAGDTVCAGPDGKVVKMSREDVREWPDRIVGIVSEIPNYETWGTGEVPVNNRIWIKVK